MHEVIMPKLSLTMETGTIEKWHKKEGDMVETGDILFEVMTDKVSLEVEAYHSGYVRKILKNEGEEVPVTEVVAYIGEKNEKIPEVSQAKPATGTAISSRTEEAKKPQEKKSIIENISVNETDIKMSPLAKSIAKEMGIDYRKEKIKGTGPDGRIIKEDIVAFSKIQKTRSVATETGQMESDDILSPMQAVQITQGEIKIKSSTPLRGVRKVIAERMTFAAHSIPHIRSTVIPCVDKLMTFKNDFKDKAYLAYNKKITLTDFIIKACAVVLKEHPAVNSSFQNNSCVIYDDINIGLAVAANEGLIVPTIYNSDKLSILEIAKTRADLIEKAKKNNLTLEEISNGTFTISNLGMFGIRTFTSIINPPQGAILSVGEVYTTPTYIGDKIEPRSYMEVSIAVDHRIMDGIVAARFLQRLVEIVESPEILFL